VKGVAIGCQTRYTAGIVEPTRGALMASHSSKTGLVIDWITDRIFRMVLAFLLAVSFDRRRGYCGWFVAHIVAPFAGFRPRIRTNLKLIYPEMPTAEIERMVMAVPDNIGRSMIETYSGDAFIARVAASPLSGPGLAALDAAHRDGRPVLLVTGHIGNHDAIRAALILRGYHVGVLYRPMSNSFFNQHYVAALSKTGTPLFARGRKGLTDMVRFMKRGGMVGVVLDQHMKDGEALSFMGKTAMTSLSVAQMALRYDALVVPAYGLRCENGDFDLIVGAPIEKGDASVMTQALNDDLEHQVRAHPDQWLWTHRRWRNLTKGMSPNTNKS
jgi:Kdo2-lipid IVA lauroyltransferase/acyltransferase